MKTNRAFWKALHSLTHPLSILAILLLLFNDHWLRHTYPSWLTGKLGDFTWLLFAPFITAILFALIIPKTVKNHTQIVGLLSIGFIGIWFATAKTVPFVHWMTTETLSMIVGYRGSLRMDVTDLWTIPALILSWHIWLKSAETSMNLKPVGYVALGIGILGTMASDDPSYEYTAIETICELDDGRLVTSFKTGYVFPDTSDWTYVSRDGGFQWTRIEGTFVSDDCSDQYTLTAINPTNTDFQYRWVKDDYVEQSTDAGETWTRIHDLDELDQDVREYSHQEPYHKPYSPEARYLPSPVSGIVHSETGNLVLAMSRDGVLVIAPNNRSFWVTVGDFQLDNLRDATLIDEALSVHKILLPTLWFLIMVTTIVLIHSHRLITKLWLTIGWVHWVLLVVFAHKVFDAVNYGSRTASDIAFFWGLSALVSLVFIAIPMVIWALYQLIAHYGRAFKQISITVILASLAYLLPLILWTQGTIPRYVMAAFFSLLLVACVLWACYQQFKDKLPAKYQPEKAKRKQKEV